MKIKLLSAISGVFLIGFGFSLQPVHSVSKHFTPHKHKPKKTPTKPNTHELRSKLRAHMSVAERNLYNQIREISRNKDKSTEERIEQLVELSEGKEMNRPKRNIILNNAVLLAHVELQGEDREGTLKKLEDVAPQSKWLLEKSPNQNLLKLSKMQYDILTGSEDL